MYRLVYILVFLFVRILFPCKICGRNNWPKKQPMVVVCNHLSNLDVVYITGYISEKKSLLAKRELAKKKLFGRFLKFLGAIFIDRNSLDLAAIKQSLGALKQGKKLVIFPEGTRNKDDEGLQDIKNGASMLAIKARVPVLPLHIEKRGKVFRRNKLIIGQPISLEQFYEQKLTKDVLGQASGLIEQELLALQNQNKK